ncbi:uncharacterized protein METZ01_LOCUS357310 [marine metagenome]|uniref:Uncharacterized protein n=1 Tax=marine metagenome TaxID=408172 RepID=A0A382S3I1_9ZZZZ
MAFKRGLCLDGVPLGGEEIGCFICSYHNSFIYYVTSRLLHVTTDSFYLSIAGFSHLFRRYAHPFFS